MKPGKNSADQTVSQDSPIKKDRSIANSSRETLIKRLYQEAKLVHRLIFSSPTIGSASTDYDKYWESRLSGPQASLNRFQMYRADWVASRIQRGARVLDIGCGDGGILMRLRKTKEIIPIGADVSERVLRYLAANGISPLVLDLKTGSLGALPKCDHILLFEVLEHLQNPEDLLKEALEKANKSVFFSVPNTGYFPYRLRMLFGRFPVQWRVHPGEHLRFWTYKDMKWWLKELGLLQSCELTLYRGIPLLNRVRPSLFGMGLIGEIRLIKDNEE